MEILGCQTYNLGNHFEWLKTSIEFAMGGDESKDDLICHMKKWLKSIDLSTLLKINFYFYFDGFVILIISFIKYALKVLILFYESLFNLMHT